jgi:hypothetical protein
MVIAESADIGGSNNAAVPARISSRIICRKQEVLSLNGDDIWKNMHVQSINVVKSSGFYPDLFFFKNSCFGSVENIPTVSFCRITMVTPSLPSEGEAPQGGKPP